MSASSEKGAVKSPGRRPAAKGLAARKAAAAILRKVVDGGVPFDALVDEASGHRDFRNLDRRDRALTRMIVETALRHRGEIKACLDQRLDRPLDTKNGGAISAALHVGAAQILFLDVPDHAAVNLAVTAVEQDRRIRHARGLVNSVLRRLGREREEILKRTDRAILNVPPWLFRRWTAYYGDEATRAIAIAHMARPQLDLTPLHDAEQVARMTGGTVLPTGSVRVERPGRVSSLPGYDTGAWWVQDAAAAIPARLVRASPGMAVADLCAAPGGKTAQLSAAGAHVTAVDQSELRLKRLSTNLDRLGLKADCVSADILTWQPNRSFDAVFLDAPCTATGTIRRHPDIAWLKSEADIESLSALQERMLDKASNWLKPGGVLVFCTCSLEPEEGEHQVDRFLTTHPGFELETVTADETGGIAAAINEQGCLRTLPSMTLFDDGRDHFNGFDGFFAARFRKTQ